MVAANRPAEMQLSASPIVVPDLLRSRGIASVDFLKIDVDGKDFEILNSFDAALDGFGILGVGIEVTFPGAAGETDQSFHNVDRFMKARGFELCNLTTRRYSLSALPAPYVHDVPAQTMFGRPLLGDALYTRDLAAPEHAGAAAGLDPAKLLNLVGILAAFDLPDGGAEILLRFRDRVAGLVDVNHVLDLLAAQAQAPVERPLTYRELVERFEGQDPMFFSAGASPKTPADPGADAGEGAAVGEDLGDGSGDRGHEEQQVLEASDRLVPRQASARPRLAVHVIRTELEGVVRSAPWF